MSCGGAAAHIELQLLAELSKQIEQVDQKLDALASEDDRIKLLQSVPGVGPRLSETVVAHIDDPHRFKTAAQVASYAGLVPKQMESGTVKRSGRITRRGPALLRSMLVEVAWMVYMRCDWAKRFVQRISGGVAARKKIAIVALARKLLVMLWAMLRDNRPFVDPAASPPEDTAPKRQYLLWPRWRWAERTDGSPDGIKSATTSTGARDAARPRLTRCVWRINAVQRMRRAVCLGE
jgi:hypothetical protein